MSEADHRSRSTRYGEQSVRVAVVYYSTSDGRFEILPYGGRTGGVD